MDVERFVPNSTDDDSTNNLTQDRTSVQVHHNHDISLNFHDRKNKNYINFLIILTPMKITMVIIKLIKKKYGSLWTNERSIPVPQFLQSVLDPNIACVYPYVA
jgi:hypothetical protein